MASNNGILKYWNGSSGWITQSGTEELCTCQSRDVMVLLEDIADPTTVERDSIVTYELYEYGAWRAYEVALAPQ